MSVLLEFAMFPTDKGESVSSYVSKIIDMIDKTGVDYQLTPMGTIIECDDMDEALEIVKSSYKCLENDCSRIYSTLTFDIRKGEKGRLKSKIKSVENRLKREINH